MQRFHTFGSPLPSDWLLWCEFARPGSGTMRPLRRPNLFDWLSVCADRSIIPCPDPVCSLLRCGHRTLKPSPNRALLTGFRPHSPLSRQGRFGLPMFPGNPIVLLSCSTTPARPRRLAFTALGCCPRLLYNEDSSDASVSRLYHTTSALAVYASCRHCCTATQDSLPVVANLFRVGL